MAPGKKGIKHYIVTGEDHTMACEHHEAKFYVDDPPTPFVRSLIGYLQEGTVIEIHGMMWEKCNLPSVMANSLTVDLAKSTAGWSDECFIYFHIGVRDPCTKTVALNSHVNGWQNEVDHEADISSGAKFYIVIKVTGTGYVVTINDSTYPEFPQRDDVRNVRAIEIGGFINLSKVSIKNLQEADDFEADANRYCEGLTNQVDLCRNNEPVLLALNQESPLNCTIAGGIICRKVVFKGIPVDGHTRFGVSLKEVNSADIAVYFEVRFDQQKCVMNSLESGSWKEELSIYQLPFEYNEEFMLTFFCDNTETVVFIGDDKMESFCHRLPPYKINRLEIGSGVKILALALLPGYCAST
uniref:32 kDa beta-galactoside-binding lectin-like n=1 Tax=Myxine glutinosa TaxID=7769 RepID=UPI00358E5CB5